MKTERRNCPYGSNSDSHDMDEGFDYMLFRQDRNGTERVYFDSKDRNLIYEKIGEGDIPIHPSYSLLYCRTEELLGEIEDLGCFALVRE